MVNCSSLLTFLYLVYLCDGKYTIRIAAVQYHNPDNEDWDGGCCDAVLFSCNTCDLYFSFCIRNKDLSASNSDNCWNTVRSYGAVTSGDHYFPWTGELYSGAGLTNPITFNREEAWLGPVQVLVTSWDSDSNADDLVDRNAFNLNLSPNGQWSGELYANGFYDRAQFKIQVQLYCQSNFYSSDCTVYCVAQNDDTNGHYTCGSNGEKVCNTGYTNPSESCLTPICSSGCSSENGYCNTPGQCLCNNGWTGTNCNQCIPKSGCSSSYGHCMLPNDCICEEGYGGSLCTEDHNVCGHQEPCLHGASCTNIIPNSYICTCPGGYTGTNCGSEINECNSDPCQNDGSCIDQLNGYVCQCPPGWTGSECQIDIDDCISDPCQNNGTCTNSINDYTCLCANGFIGPNCAGHQCDFIPCDHNGTCVQVASGYMCACPPGYTGVNCTYEINDCSPNPCQNNGTCTDALANYVCTCFPGFTGKSCQFNINECIGSNCSEHSVCLDGVDSYTCICDTGYTGQYCQTQIDYCSAQPCLNNATCNNYPGYYTCNCQDGFNGTHCDNNINDCASDPCQNGGTCTDMIRSFVCTCPLVYTGLTCNTIVSACDPSPCSSPYECIDNTSSIISYYCEFCLENVCQILGNPTPVTSAPTIVPVVGGAGSEWGPYLGIALGGALLSCCTVTFFICCCCYCKKKRKVTELPLEDAEQFSNNPTYIPPDLLSSTLQRSTSPQYGAAALKVVLNPLYVEGHPPCPRKDGYERLSSSDDNSSPHGRQRLGSNLLFSGMYDKLSNSTKQNVYNYDPIDGNTVSGRVVEDSYKEILDVDSFPPLKDYDLLNPYETIPIRSPDGNDQELKTSYEAALYETIPARIYETEQNDI